MGYLQEFRPQTSLPHSQYYFLSMALNSTEYGKCALPPMCSSVNDLFDFKPLTMYLIPEFPMSFSVHFPNRT